MQTARQSIHVAPHGVFSRVGIASSNRLEDVQMKAGRFFALARLRRGVNHRGDDQVAHDLQYVDHQFIAGDLDQLAMKLEVVTNGLHICQAGPIH